MNPLLLVFLGLVVYFTPFFLFLGAIGQDILRELREERARLSGK